MQDIVGWAWASVVFGGLRYLMSMKMHAQWPMLLAEEYTLECACHENIAHIPWTVSEAETRETFQTSRALERT